MDCKDTHWDETERWSSQRIRQFQLRRLKRVIAHAHDHLPFYRRRFEDAGFHPSQLVALKDMGRIPTFRKEELIDLVRNGGSFPVGMEQIEDDQQKGLDAALCMTSGTTGEMFIYASKKWVRFRGKQQMRILHWSGLQPGMQVLLPAPGWHSLSFVQSWALSRLGANTVVPWGTFLPSFAGRYVDALLKHKPEFLYLFLPMLYAMLAECRRRGLPPVQAFESVRRVLVVGEALTPNARAKLIKDLGVEDIYEGAGNPEGLEAHECSYHRGHHLFIHTCYAEILGLNDASPVKPGERGRIILTSLADLSSSSYIRFDTQDIGAFLPGDCECGRTWPLIEVYGRASDTITVGPARIMHYDVRQVLEETPGLVGAPFALLDAEPRTSLRLVLERPSSQGNGIQQEQLERTLRSRFDVPVEIRFSEMLPVRWKGVKVVRERELWERLA